MIARTTRIPSVVIGILAVIVSLIGGCIFALKPTTLPEGPKGAALSLFLSYNWSLNPVKPPPTPMNSMRDRCMNFLKSDLKERKITRLRFTSLKNMVGPVPDGIGKGLISTEGGQNYRFVVSIWVWSCYSVQADPIADDPNWSDEDRFPS